jgi:hypothetical protein
VSIKTVETHRARLMERPDIHDVAARPEGPGREAIDPG